MDCDTAFRQLCTMTSRSQAEDTQANAALAADVPHMQGGPGGWRVATAEEDETGADHRSDGSRAGRWPDSAW